MMIGIVLLGAVAALLFFGVAERVFKSFGVAYWQALVILGAMLGSAFIPTFTVGAVVFNIAGFFAPLVFAAGFFALAKRASEIRRALVAASVVTAMSVAVWLLVLPSGNTVVAVISVGLLCGAVGYIVGKSKIAALCAILLGMPIGEVVASAVGMYTFGAPLAFGTPSAFDATVLASVFSVALFESISAIKKALNGKAKAKPLGSAEFAQEFDPEEYKKYFDE